MKRSYRLTADYGWNVEPEERRRNTPNHPQTVVLEAESLSSAFDKAATRWPNVPNWKAD